MWDLVGNPEDQFSHNEAQFAMENAVSYGIGPCSLIVKSVFLVCFFLCVFFFIQFNVPFKIIHSY